MTTTYSIGPLRCIWLAAPDLDVYRQLLGPIPLHALDPELWGDQA